MNAAITYRGTSGNPDVRRIRPPVIPLRWAEARKVRRRTFMLLRTTTTSACLALLGLCFFACSSGGSADSGKSEPQVKAAPTSTTKDATSPPAGPAKAAPAAAAKNVPTAATCGAKANHSDCLKCCYGDKGENIKPLFDASNACTCAAAKSKCTAECAKPYCSTDSASEGSSSSDDPCAACQIAAEEFDKCDAAGKTACAADPTCAAADECATDSQCDKKPPGPDEGEDSTNASATGPDVGIEAPPSSSPSQDTKP
jgi:hypothetical protein